MNSPRSWRPDAKLSTPTSWFGQHIGDWWSPSLAVKRVGIGFWEQIILSPIMNPTWFSTPCLKFFIICVGNKSVRIVVYATMDPWEFVMMPLLFQNHGDRYNFIYLYLLYYEWVIQKAIHLEWWKFPCSVICRGLYTKMFGMLTHKCVILYGIKNIEWPTHIFWV